MYLLEPHMLLSWVMVGPQRVEVMGDENCINWLPPFTFRSYDKYRPVQTGEKLFSEHICSDAKLIFFAFDKSITL